MHRQRYCVYNQNNECFLSLGATLGGGPFARLKQWIGFDSPRVDEGMWVRLERSTKAISFFSGRDLVYLDANHRVVHLEESFPMLRVIPIRRDAETLLALPLHSISASRTEAGDHLLICAALEMEQHLRSLREQQPQKASRASRSATASQAAVVSPTTLGGVRRAPASVTCYGENGDLTVHAIRDLSATGLYLVTSRRWPIGAELRMSLQPDNFLDRQSTSPVTVRMRVTSWGSDGVGLEFAAAAAEVSDATSQYVC